VSKLVVLFLARRLNFIILA